LPAALTKLRQQGVNLFTVRRLQRPDVAPQSPAFFNCSGQSGIKFITV